MKFKVRTVPTVILVDDKNNEIKRTMGFKIEELNEIISML